MERPRPTDPVGLEADVLTRPRAPGGSWSRAGTSLAHRPAPVWARLSAAAVDSVVLTLPLLVVVLLGVHAARTLSEVWDFVSTLAIMCWVVAALLYSVVGTGEGQTPGQRALRIVVVDQATGGPIGYERALVRSLVLLLMVLPCCLGVLSVVMLRAGRRGGWHDRAAGALVVRGSLP